MNYEITHVTGTGRYDSGGSLGENFKAKSIQLENLLNLRMADGGGKQMMSQCFIRYCH